MHENEEAMDAAELGLAVPEPEPKEEAPAKPKRKPAKKKEPNYKAELKKAQEEIEDLKRSLETSEKKNGILFHENMKAKEELEKSKYIYTQAIDTTIDAVGAAFRSLMLTTKGR